MYKTIVVHVDGSPQQDSRMAAAARLAREHGAHLVGSAATGISWTDYLILTGSMAAPVPPADFDGLRETAALHLRGFTDHAARLGIASVETRVVEDTADGALLLQARYADLVVLSRDVDPDPGIPPRARRLPEHVALRGVRPVLVVPPGYADEPIASTVVAGWDGSTQALRALAAALPLLARADGVRLVLVNPDQLSDAHGEQPGADMALYLARHGVKVDVVLERTHATAGAALMALAHSAGAGLIVAGAYGHSRYREWVLGGVTRELLERTPVPLLLAH
ncbi:Universal stress protein family protein [Massilia sp. PDC64]|nr:universal stress protein [Massilia sp. PDC64]SDE94453.1 Universal stress protein family protein [Massilia sp. PDC64]